MTDQLLDPDDVCRLLDIGRSTLETYRFPGQRADRWPRFPDPVRRFGRTPVWLRRDIDDWNRKRKAGTK